MAVFWAEEVVEQSGHETSCGLRTGDDEECSVDDDLILIEVLLVALLEEVVQEVPVLVRRVALPDALEDLLAGVVEMLDALLAKLSRSEQLEEDLLVHRPRGGKTSRCLFDGPGFDGFRDQGHPEAQVGGGQASEGLTEGEMADDVEGGVAEPIGDVAHLSIVGKLIHLVPEDVDVRLDKVLLLQEGLCTERVRQRPSLSSMVRIISHGNGHCARDSLHGAHMDGVLEEVGVAGTRAVNVLP